MAIQSLLITVKVFTWKVYNNADISTRNCLVRMQPTFTIALQPLVLDSQQTSFKLIPHQHPSSSRQTTRNPRLSSIYTKFAVKALQAVSPCSTRLHLTGFLNSCIRPLYHQRQRHLPLPSMCVSGFRCKRIVGFHESIESFLSWFVGSTAFSWMFSSWASIACSLSPSSTQPA